MVSTTRRALLLVAAATAAAVPSAAADEGPQVVDRCYDHAVVAAEDPWGERLVVFAGSYGGDLRSAEVRVSRPRHGTAALDLRVDFCPRTGGGGNLTVAWDHGDGCVTRLTYKTWPDHVERSLVEACAGGTLPVPERQVSALTLRPDEAVLTTRGLGVRVPLSRIPAASSARYQPGGTWSSLRVLSTAHPVVSGPVTVRAHGWGTEAGSGYDTASGGDYTIGSAQ